MLSQLSGPGGHIHLQSWSPNVTYKEHRKPRVVAYHSRLWVALNSLLEFIVTKVSFYSKAKMLECNAREKGSLWLAAGQSNAVKESDFVFLVGDFPQKISHNCDMYGCQKLAWLGVVRYSWAVVWQEKPRNRSVSDKSAGAGSLLMFLWFLQFVATFVEMHPPLVWILVYFCSITGEKTPRPTSPTSKSGVVTI